MRKRSSARADRRARKSEPRAPRVSKKEAKLLETAVELFKRYGIKRVSVTEICATAEVSKVTFYKFFPNKVELAKRVINVLADRNVERMDEIESRKIGFPEKVAALVAERVRLAREWSPAFIEELYHAEPEVAACFAERANGVKARCVDFIRRAQAAGDVPREIHPDVALSVLDKLYELGADEQLVQRAGSFENLTRDVNHIFFYGLLRRD